MYLNIIVWSGDGLQVVADSRIPQVDFGTPEQDALRRDFTINSLFYNIDSEVVEDLTGHGKEDLKAGLIRTPLPARETFQDGELRFERLAVSGCSRGKIVVCLSAATLLAWLVMIGRAFLACTVSLKIRAE